MTIIAKLYFRYGAMNSSKSAELLIVAYNYEQSGMNPLCLKPSTDTRDTNIKSRIGLERKCLTFSNDTNLFELIHKNKDVKVVLVDEAQFITKKQAHELLEVVVKLSIPVMCYGLKLNYKGEPFDGSSELLSLAHDLQEIKTVCKCGSKATHHLLKVNGNYTFDGNGVFIGDTEYGSVCAKCWYKEKEKHKTEV